MSTFAVTVEEIKEILLHDNADSLELGTLTSMSFQFVVRKGAFKAGDRVIYFPLDSLIPEDLQEVLGVKGYLAGSEKNRVKTVKLRGAISQGIVASWSVVEDYLTKKYAHSKNPDLFLTEDSLSVGQDITQLLGVEKYDPPGIEAKGCTLWPLPATISMYDIEGADRYPEVVDVLMDRVVEITEKMEGTNFWVHLTRDGEFLVGQRRDRIESPVDSPHAFQKYADENLLRDLLAPLFQRFVGVSYLTLRGEFLGPGIQGNYYGLKSKKVTFFDLEKDGIPLDKDIFRDVIPEEHRVPCLSSETTLREWLAGRTIQEASNGKSLVNPQKMREGIVITPNHGQDRHLKIGRLFIKQRSPAYLAKTDF